MYRILRTEEYKEWFGGQSNKAKYLIQCRLERITDHGHFGEAKHLYKDLSELKWKSGTRIYFSIILDKESRIIILLLGGNKNSQNYDIPQARKLAHSFIKVFYEKI